MGETFDQPAQGAGERYDLVLLTVTGFQGRRIRLTTRQWGHAVEHGPYMLQLQGALRETLESPDEVRQSRDDPNTVKLYYKWHNNTPVGSKLMCVVVKFLERDDFVLTAYLTDRFKPGVLIWLKEL